MSFSLECRWQGIEQLKQVLSRAPPELKTRIHKKMDQKSADVVFFARHYAPIRTGYLRSLINYRSIGFLQFIIGAYAPYSGFVEYGTSKMRAQPYMRPAFSIATRTLKSELIQEILSYFNDQTWRG